jgi:hypothetical protein
MSNDGPKKLPSKHKFLGKPGSLADATRVIVRKNGVINDDEAPTILISHKNDIAIWFCENRAGEKIRIEIDFLTKNAASPVDFLSPNPINLAAGAIGVIIGRVNRPPKKSKLLGKRLREKVHYTVRVKGASFGTIDYDPDLEIKP